MATKRKAAQPETALVLRCCAADSTSYGGFVWPDVGEEVVAPDWQPTPECGNGLHGWLHGAGDHSCTSYHERPDAKWIVVEVVAATIIMLGGKCKFPRGIVRFKGAKYAAADYIIANSKHARNCAVIGASLTVGDGEGCVVGAHGTATAGYSGTATAGDSGTATAGDYGTATAGYYGTATAGYSGTATAGYSGTATAGYSGTATAGYSGTLCIKWYDKKASRYRTAVGYVGEDGIAPNVAYRLNDKQEFVQVTQ